MSKGVQIGLSDVYISLLVDDPLVGTASYETPERLVGAIAANINPNASAETLFADDGPFETASTIGGITLELNVADLPLEWQAKLLGHKIEGGILKRRADDIPPWVAVGFRSLKSNGKYRYTWLAKGKFSPSEQGNETKGDAINFQTPTITGSFVKRDSDGEWERHADEDHPDYVSSIGAGWFASPIAVVDNSALTITVSPADAATAVPKTDPIKWTFNKPLSLAVINQNNFMVLKDDVPVPGDLTTNAGKTIVTFTPSVPLAGSKIYTALVTANVKDIYGVSLTAPKITTFTTSA